MEGEEGKQQSLVQEAMRLGIMGWRNLTPRWVNDPVWRHDDEKGREGRGMSR